jgi:ATP-dependent protease ClpP protease subunit
MRRLSWQNDIEPEIPDRKLPINNNKKDDDQQLVEHIDGHIYFYSDVTSLSVIKLNKVIREITNNMLPYKEDGLVLKLHINSDGGVLLDGLAALDSIISNALPIHTYVEGGAASAATLISVAGKKRFMHRHSFMLIHQMSSRLWGKYEEIKDDKENCDRFMKMIKDIYKEYTKVPMKKIDEILKHDLWFDADQCLEYGMIDEIV